MDADRANPDQLLQNIKREDDARRRGHLKIFFGYAAGVGKTYAMLKAAHAARQRGVDVAVGYVEPHARPNTMALLAGLECLPCLSVSHKGIQVREFDLDGAIARHPRLILVDELAHTNHESCRHAKRYQDVEELLKAGIDVYTTVNVQHMESLNDMVASITGITVRERIPDSLFDNADQVELVDIEPQELIERLHTGEVYKDAQAQKALGNFFTIENLTALREIALRRCADRVNRLAEKVRMASGSRGGYYTDEHILVCLSSSPTNAKIIRNAARMASAFKGSFTALFVETPAFAVMGEEDKNRLRSNIRLAQQLGAVIETVYGEDIALQIAEFARISGVSKIVMGRSSVKSIPYFKRTTLTDRLVAYNPNLDVYIIPDKDTPVYNPKRPRKKRPDFQPGDILKAILLLCAATLIGFAFYYWGFSEANIITIYILSVLITAIVTNGRIYSLVTSVLSVLVFNFFFTNPRFTLNAYDRGYPVTFLIMLLAAFISSTLVIKIKQYARQTAQTAYRTKILLETNQLLQSGKGREEIAAVIAGQLTKLLKRDVVFYLADKGKLSVPVVYGAGPDTPVQDYTAENEKAVAAWVYKNNKHAGATTGTLGSARCLYLSVRVNDVVYGVAGIAAREHPLDTFENNIVLSILGECGLALENEKALREKAESELLARNEKLRANLLRSISHDLRTPLTSISGNAGILLSNGDSLEPDKKQQLYTDIYDDSLWLINLVENLLSVTRIEDGSMHLHKNAELLDEVVSEAMRHINRKSSLHHITVTQSEEFIMAKMDARLIIQVIINLVDNAVKYTPEGSHIDIQITKENHQAVVTVADDGDGIPDESKSKIFDMFYTAGKGVADSRRSMGLGLALCKSIVTAHGGEITVADNKPKGALFRFTLPAEEVTLHE